MFGKKGLPGICEAKRKKPNASEGYEPDHKHQQAFLSCFVAPKQSFRHRKAQLATCRIIARVI